MAKTIYSITGGKRVPRPERYVVEALCEGYWIELWSYKKSKKAIRVCDDVAKFFEATRVQDLDA